MRLSLDSRLLEEARLYGNHKTSEEAVIAALNEYIRRRSGGFSAQIGW